MSYMQSAITHNSLLMEMPSLYWNGNRLLALFMPQNT